MSAERELAKVEAELEDYLLPGMKAHEAIKLMKAFMAQFAGAAEVAAILSEYERKKK